MYTFNSKSFCILRDKPLFVVDNPTECYDFQHLIGEDCRIDGRKYRVLNVERNAIMPPYRKGMAIGLLVDKIEDTEPILPQTPDPELLMSMALRYDHGLGMPGHYDQGIYQASGISHKQRLEATLSTMKQLYEEVAGYGFYKPDRKDSYAKLLKDNGIEPNNL